MHERVRIGVLGVQGDVSEHLAALERVGVDASIVKSIKGLESGEALIVPGGESTTVIKLVERFGLSEPIRKRVHDGMPFWGTCMGMIVAAHDVAGLDQPTLDLIDITVKRNAFGRQVESAEIPLVIDALGSQPFPAVFIRAPWVERAGRGVETLASHEGHGVFVRAGNVIGSSFHPELTGDTRLHAYFARMVEDARERV